MLSKHETVDDSNHTLLVVGVLHIQRLEDASLNQTLLMQAFLVSEDFNGHDFAGLVVVALKDLTETAFAYDLLNLEAVDNVVAHLGYVLTILRVETVILGVFLGVLFPFLVFFFVTGVLINIINRWEVKNFA